MSDSNDNESEETNFLSPKFNPMKALYSSRVRLPFPNATIFNNIREYEWVVDSRKRDDQTRHAGCGSAHSQKNEDPGKGRSQEEHTAARSSSSDSRITRSEATRIRKKGEQIPLGTGFRATHDMLIDTWKKKPAFRTVLTRISEYSAGPLSFLSRCMEERCKVRVCTRSFKGLRGVCSGYLVTFDKFFNMALVDVDEVWRRPSTGQRFYHEETVTFTKIMQCFKTEAPLQKMEMKDTKEVPAFDNQSGGIYEKQPEASQKHDSGASEKQHANRPGKGLASKQRSKEHSEKNMQRDSHKHRRRKDEKSCKSERKTKDLRDDQEKSEEEDEDIKELQRRLAALQRQLTSLSDQSDAEDTPADKQVPTNEDPHKLATSTDLGDEKTGDVALDARTKSKGLISGNEKSCTSESKRDCEVTQDHRLGKSTATTGTDKMSHKSTQGEEQSVSNGSPKVKIDRKTSTTVKKGRLEINRGDFKKRHVNQLFIRGDNVVFVSVESNIFPK